MKTFPREVRSSEGQLRIVWNDGHEGRYAARDLRMACRCAACVDEWTHERLIRDELIPAQVKPSTIEVVGNYALHFGWNDGHSTGIFSYDYLRELCACDLCRSGRSFHV